MNAIMEIIRLIAGVIGGSYLIYSFVVVIAIVTRWKNRNQIGIIWGWWTAVVVVMALTVSVIGRGSEPQKVAVKPQSALQTQLKPSIDVKPPHKTAPPAESRAEYEKAAKRIGNKTDPIYIKAFTKNPDKYTGQRVKVSVKVFKIEEQYNKTLMNVYLSKDYEPAIVYYEGESDIYDGDVIMVYGEVIGRLEGQNALGASMTWPTIHARYFKKLKDEE